MYFEILVLSQLMSGPKYGYEIKKNLVSILSKGVVINNNVLYPMFKRFVKSKMVEKRVQQQKGKPSRYIYSITEAGSNHFYHLISYLPDNLAQNLEEFLTRVCYFEYIDKDSCEKIINKRNNYLEILIENYDYLSENNNMNFLESSNGISPKFDDFIGFEKAKIQIELQLIERLRKKYID